MRNRNTPPQKHACDAHTHGEDTKAARKPFWVGGGLRDGGGLGRNCDR